MNVFRIIIIFFKWFVVFNKLIQIKGHKFCYLELGNGSHPLSNNVNNRMKIETMHSFIPDNPPVLSDPWVPLVV